MESSVAEIGFQFYELSRGAGDLLKQRLTMTGGNWRSRDSTPKMSAFTKLNVEDEG